MSKWIIASLCMCLPACSQEPLIFASTNTYGDNQPLAFNVGYKSRGASIVPTTTLDRAGTSHEVRGCFEQALGSGATTACAGQDGTSGQSGAPKSAANSDASELPTTARVVPAKATRLMPITNFSLPRSSTGSESMRDSLSVFSSFDSGASVGQTTGTSGGAQIGFSLGKVFATGIAAQQLTEGQNYFLQNAATTSCLSQLANAMGSGKVTEAAAKICAGGSGQQGQ
jgi:hypothetical protein